MQELLFTDRPNQL